MALIKGMTVQLAVKEQTGVDGFNNPIYAETLVDVENVIVAPASSDDITSSLNLHGKKAVYTLGIPKGDTHEWRDTTVNFFGKTFHTFGEPIEGIEENIPLEWNKKVMVEFYG